MRRAVLGMLLVLFFQASPIRAQELILCGWDEVFVLDLAKVDNGLPRKIWSWQAKDCPNLPKELLSAFRTTDDCKPVDADRILITASSGGVALIERSTKKALFWARVVNAHSADLLPGDRIAVASSVGEQGNRLALFDVRTPGKELYHDDLDAAHGAVWDEARRVLWALGNDELRSYRLRDWDTDHPRLEQTAVYKVPEAGGHDLVPLPSSPELVLTTSKHVYRFDRDKSTFAPYPPLADRSSIKCVNVHPRTGRVVFTQADRPDWWSDTVRFLNPDSELRLAGLRLYKARWDVASPDTDMRTVRERLLAPLREAPEAREVGNLLGSLRPDGSWPDVDYQSQRRSGWSTSRHLGYLASLARAYTSPRSSLHGDSRLKKAVMASLDFWLAHDFQNPNWWHNRIGVPKALAPILLLLDDELSDAQRRKGVEILSRADLSMTGQNLVWLAQIVASRGILLRNSDVVAAAYRRIGDEIRITTKEGIQPDFSFHQHGDCLYSHGYGAGFASDCAALAVLLDGTRFALPPEKIELVTRLVLDGHQWLARGGTPDYGAIGRQTARDGQSVHYLARVAENMLRVKTGREPEFEALARRAADQPAPALVGNRHFWCSDTMVHQRAAYYTSARMFSERIVNTDGPANGEGIKNHHIADGCNLLLRTGREYWDIFPVWDWERIPGTTVELTGNLSGSPRRKGATDFVGGVSDGLYGVAAFDFRRDKLSARKAWFFFDGEYACLGAGITCDSTGAVVTTVNQCHLVGDVFVSDGKQPTKLDRGSHALTGPAWVYHDQVAYVFPEKANLHLRNDVQTGSWHAIASEQPDRPVSQDVFSLGIEHGTHPAGAGYAYVVAPGVTLSAVPGLAAAKDVEVLRNAPELQAVRQRRLNLVGSAFYQPGRLDWGDDGSVSVDQSCLVLVRQLPDKIALVVSNPRNEPLSVSVEMNVKGWPLRTTVELPDGTEAGKSVTRLLPLPMPTGHE